MTWKMAKNDVFLKYSNTQNYQNVILFAVDRCEKKRWFDVVLKTNNVRCQQIDNLKLGYQTIFHLGISLKMAVKTIFSWRIKFGCTEKWAKETETMSFIHLFEVFFLDGAGDFIWKFMLEILWLNKMRHRQTAKGKKRNINFWAKRIICSTSFLEAIKPNHKANIWLCWKKHVYKWPV